MKAASIEGAWAESCCTSSGSSSKVRCGSPLKSGRLVLRRGISLIGSPASHSGATGRSRRSTSTLRALTGALHSAPFRMTLSSAPAPKRGPATSVAQTSAQSMLRFIQSPPKS